MGSNEVSDMDDIIDSRDVLARIHYLEGTEDEDELEELDGLKKLAEECEAIIDWEYGITLIRDSYFEQYAEDLADDIGAIDRNATWPLNHIDWEAAANELKMDYTSVEFNNVTYWAR